MKPAGNPALMRGPKPAKPQPPVAEESPVEEGLSDAESVAVLEASSEDNSETPPENE
ncbi:MAG: hypothetical protein HC769_13145 [Cyanobacteria bacterium CRU_2_1]|nr:hypothetical protein [Cyanobacteria bacterium CRU_2_1]